MSAVGGRASGCSSPGIRAEFSLIMSDETAGASSRLEATFPLRYNEEQIVFY